MSQEESQEVIEIEETLTLKPNFPDNVDSFDNEDSFSDLDFVVAGLERPLMLHKMIVGRASAFAQKIMKCKQTADSEDKNTIVWPFDTTKDVDRDALKKALRFFYGNSAVVGMKDGECCAMIATLIRLQLIHMDDVIEKLINFAVEQGMKDVRAGAELLILMQDYPELCDETTCKLEQELTKVVLTSKNISENSDVIVDNCLMSLPAKFLDMTEYGALHTQFSEFHVRLQYVRTHVDDLESEEKQEIMMKCDWTKLQSNELKQLCDLGIFGTQLMISIYQSILENTEKERDEERLKRKKVEEEKNMVLKRENSLESFIEENSLLNKNATRKLQYLYDMFMFITDHTLMKL